MELVSYKAIVFDLGGNMKGYEGMEMSEKDFEKKKELFLEQKKIMDTFLKTGAISQMQYEKSYGDLVKKMGMESIAEELKSKKWRWNGGLTMEIDESVFIADGAKVLGEDIKIGADCSIWYNAVVRCDDGEHVHIGDKTNIQDLCMVHTSPGRPTTIGKSVTIGHSCIIHGCTIGDNSLIGMGTILLDGAVIGKNCIIGAGSLVTKNTEIPDGSMAFGRPAKVVRELTEIEIMTNQGTAEWYVNEAGKHKNSQ